MLLDANKANLSHEIKSELQQLMLEHCTYLDMNDPGAPLTWSKEHEQSFIDRSGTAFDKNAEGA